MLQVLVDKIIFPTIFNDSFQANIIPTIILVGPNYLLNYLPKWINLQSHIKKNPPLLLYHLTILYNTYSLHQVAPISPFIVHKTDTDKVYDTQNHNEVGVKKRYKN